MKKWKWSFKSLLKAFKIFVLYWYILNKQIMYLNADSVLKEYFLIISEFSFKY